MKLILSMGLLDQETGISYTNPVLELNDAESFNIVHMQELVGNYNILADSLENGLTEADIVLGIEVVEDNDE